MDLKQICLDHHEADLRGDFALVEGINSKFQKALSEHLMEKFDGTFCQSMIDLLYEGTEDEYTTHLFFMGGVPCEVLIKSYGFLLVYKTYFKPPITNNVELRGISTLKELISSVVEILDSGGVAQRSRQGT